MAKSDSPSGATPGSVLNVNFSAATHLACTRPDWSLRFRSFGFWHRDQSFSIFFEGNSGGADGLDTATISVRLGLQDLLIVVPKSLLEGALQRAVPGAVPNYDGHIRDLAYLAHMGSGFLTALEAAGIVNVSLVNLTLDQPDEQQIFAALKIASDIGHFACTLWLAGDLSVEKTIHDHLCRLSKFDPELESIPVALSLIAGTTALAVGDLTRLAVGMGIKLDWSPFSAGLLCLDGAGTRHFLELSTRKATILPQDDAKALSALRTVPAVGKAHPTEPLHMLDVEDIAIILTFEVARHEITLSELRKLGVGSTFSLDHEPGKELVVLANGHPIGTGDIVQAAGEHVIRVTSLKP